MSVLLGNGNGTFQCPRNIGMAHATSVAVGDFNADGKLDLGVTSSMALTPGYYGDVRLRYPGHYVGYANVLVGNRHGLVRVPRPRTTSATGMGHQPVRECRGRLQAAVGRRHYARLRPTRSLSAIDNGIRRHRDWAQRSDGHVRSHITPSRRIINFRTRSPSGDVNGDGKPIW